MPTSPTPITTLPPAPSENSPETFSTVATTFVAALPVFKTQIDDAGVVTYDNAIEATAGAAVVTSSSIIVKWVSGTTYVEGDMRWSPTDWQTYRRKTNGAGTTDPSADSTNWVLLSGPGNGKDVAGGYPGLTAYKVNFKNASGANLSTIGHSNTAARTYIFPDYNGTMAILEAQTFSGIQTFADNIVLPKTSGKGIKVDNTFTWKDLLGVMQPDPGGIGAPVLAALIGGNVRKYFYGASDRLGLDYHIPHDYVPNTDIFLHIHWGHNGTAISGNFVATFSHTYAKGHGQAIFLSEKQVAMTYATVNVSTTPRYVHRIDEIQLSTNGGNATLMDTSLLEPDGVISLDFTVTTLPTITGGSPNKVYVSYVDVHYQSTSIGTKQKSPNFYV